MGDKKKEKEEVPLIFVKESRKEKILDAIMIFFILASIFFLLWSGMQFLWEWKV